MRRAPRIDKLCPARGGRCDRRSCYGDFCVEREARKMERGEPPYDKAPPNEMIGLKEANKR